MEPDVGTGLGELNTESKIFPPHHLKENTSWILDNLQIISFPRPLIIFINFLSWTLDNISTISFPRPLIIFKKFPFLDP